MKHAKLKEAKAEIERIEQEQKHVKALEEAISYGGWLQEEDAIEYEHLQPVMDAASEFGMKTAEGEALLKRAGGLNLLRQALAVSVGSVEEEK